MPNERDFLLAAKASQGAASFVYDGGKRGISVAEAICLEGLCGPQYAGHIAAAVLLEPGSARQLYGNMYNVAKEAKAIRFSHITAISIRKYLCSPMLGKRPKLVRIGSAAALAEASMAAAVEQAAARLADLERKAAFFDAAVVGDPLALGRAMAAPSGDPVREGMIARNLLDESAIRQQRFAESLEERSMLAAQDELELSAALELSVQAGGAGLLELEAEPTAVEDTPTGGLLPRVLPRVLPPPPDEDVPEPPVFERGERVRVLACTSPGMLPRLATSCGEAIVVSFDQDPRGLRCPPERRLF